MVTGFTTDVHTANLASATRNHRYRYGIDWRTISRGIDPLLSEDESELEQGNQRLEIDLEHERGNARGGSPVNWGTNTDPLQEPGKRRVRDPPSGLDDLQSDTGDSVPQCSFKLAGKSEDDDMDDADDSIDEEKFKRRGFRDDNTEPTYNPRSRNESSSLREQPGEEEHDSNVADKRKATSSAEYGVHNIDPKRMKKATKVSGERQRGRRPPRRDGPENRRGPGCGYGGHGIMR
jgi:hypothetical protein